MNSVGREYRNIYKIIKNFSRDKIYYVLGLIVIPLIVYFWGYKFTILYIAIFTNLNVGLIEFFKHLYSIQKKYKMKNNSKIIYCLFKKPLSFYALENIYSQEEFVENLNNNNFEYRKNMLVSIFSFFTSNKFFSNLLLLFNAILFLIYYIYI